MAWAADPCPRRPEDGEQDRGADEGDQDLAQH